MTVVEFFACSPIENMISCFSLKPDKVIFIGEGRRMKRRVAAYENLARRLGIDAVFEYKSADQSSVNKICTALVEIVEQERDCCFDLTGGNELALVAMGRVFQLYEGERHLQMQRFDINTGKIADCDDDGEVPALQMGVALTGAEYIALHGGKVTHCVKIESGASPEDIDALWSICRKNPARWNKDVNRLGDLSAITRREDGGRRAVIDKAKCSALPGCAQKLVAVKSFVEGLEKASLVRDVRDTPLEYSFAYKSPIVKTCLQKAGSVLERKALLLASKLKDSGGKSFYNDCVSAVVIDWDGSVDSTGFEGTVNEIDLLLMRGFVPAFVSCKNGGVDDSELYKLSAVAERFGGAYAKKALLLSGFNKSGPARKYFLQRASDMGIRVITDADKLSDKAFARELAKIQKTTEKQTSDR